MNHFDTSLYQVANVTATDIDLIRMTIPDKPTPIKNVFHKTH